MKQLSQNDIIKLNNSFSKGQQALHANDLTKAEKLFLDVLKIRPGIFEAENALAYIYVASKQHVKASKQLKNILIHFPNDAKTHQNLANNLYEQKLYDEAIHHYLLAIKNDPKLVESHINCGISYRMIKSYDLAISFLHQALNIDNGNARAFHVLGMIYVDINDYPRALECLENATGLSPTSAEYRVSFASVLEKTGLDYEAGIEYHQACEMNPTYSDSFILYGSYLRKHHRYDEALESLTWAENLVPHELDVIDELGYTFLGMADIENATMNFNKALNVEPKRIASLTGLELTKLEIGELPEARKICDQIISIDPTNITGYLLKSRVLKAKPGDSLIDELIKFEDEVDLDIESKVIMYFALGKLFDDQNDYDNAFKYFAKGNALVDKNLNYDKDTDASNFSQLIEFYTADFLNSHKHLGCDSDLPVFIVGMPRSATTLTEQIISSHPQVIGAGEIAFWNKADIALPLRLNTSTPYPQCVAELNQKNVKDITDIYLSTLKKIAGRLNQPVHITDKMPHNFLQIGLISLLFPNAKIIHTKRDPIDTCLSIFFQHFNAYHQYAFNLENLASHYNQYMRIMRHWHNVLPGRIMDIEYSDTVADPEFWSRKLISHIGLEWNDACLAPHKLERSVKTASHWQVRQPIYKSSVERWRNYEVHLKPLINGLKAL